MKKFIPWILSVVLMTILLTLTISVDLPVGKPGRSATFYVGSVLTPWPAYATVDYQCDGVDDHIQIQQALDALPVNGGKIVIYAGNYHLGATVSRAIDNIVIEGVGPGTYLANNGVTNIFNVGVQSKWIFKDIKVDTGGISIATATEWSFDNVWIGAGYVAKRSAFTTTQNQDMANKLYVDTQILSTGNVSGSGTSGRLASWVGSNILSNSINTDLQVSVAVSQTHIQGTDTSLGTLGSGLNMGGNSITNVNLVDGVDVSSLSASLTNPMVDDNPLYFGTGNTTGLLWETADANANALLIALPTGDGTDVPVMVLGDQSAINKDLTFFNGITAPTLAVLSADESAWIRLNNTGIYSSGNFILQPNADTDDYFTFATVSNVPTLYGTGAYLRIGDSDTTSHSLASEDDLMISGKLEVDGAAYFDGTAYVTSGSFVVSTSGYGYLGPYVDSGYAAFSVKDATVGWAEIGRIVSAADPYFQIGRDDTGVATNSVTDMLVLQAGAGTNATTTNFGLGTSWKTSNSAKQVEERGSIDLVNTVATDGAEVSQFRISVMNAGSMVNPTVSINATDMTVPASFRIDGVDVSTLSTSGNVTGAGTSGYIPAWVSASVLGNSVATSNTTGVYVTGRTTTDTLQVGTATPIISLYSGSAFMSQLQVKGAAILQSADRSVSQLNYGNSATIPEHTGTGSYDYTGNTTAERLFYATAAVFDTTDDDGKMIILLSGTYTGAVVEIEHYISSTEVQVTSDNGWTSDMTGVSFGILPTPTFGIANSGSARFAMGGESTLAMRSLNATASAPVSVQVINGGNDVSAFEVDVINGGYAGNEAIDINYITGSMAASTHASILKVNVDKSGATASTNTTEIDFINIQQVGKNDSQSHAVHVGQGFDTAFSVSGGNRTDPSYGYTVVSATDTATDRVTGVAPGGTAFLDTSAGNVQMFVSNNDYILIGSTAPFEAIPVYLTTGASHNILPTFYYSTGVGTWSSLVASDTTAGFQNTGIISFNAPIAWAQTNKTLPAGASITNGYYVKIVRTRATVTTVPTESYFKLYTSSSTTDFLIRGNGTIRPVSMADTSAPNDSIYYSTTANKLVYKTSAGVVQNLY